MNHQNNLKYIFALIATCLASITSYSQAIDYTPIYRSLNSERSFRFSYENDFFSASDRDYTQGLYIELINPSLSKFLLSKLTWKTPAVQRLFGMAIETNGYTPNNIDKPAIQYADRPYASTLLLRNFNTAITPEKGRRITNTFTLGILGPWAGGKEIQTSIHHWIGYTKPEGWHNQIKNEPVLNYQLNYEKAILGNRRNFLLTAQAMARAGNLSTKASAGSALMFGRFSNPYHLKPHNGNNRMNNTNKSNSTGTIEYSKAKTGKKKGKIHHSEVNVDNNEINFDNNEVNFDNNEVNVDNNLKKPEKKLNIYFYDHASVNFVGYDATLQGGLLNRQSPYIISKSQVNRIVFQNRFGLVLSYKNLMLEYWQSFLTKEYKTGIEPKTGGLHLGIKL